jgi:hypothetical protein
MIYCGRDPVTKFPRFIWRDGDRFLIILWGIDICGGEPKPVYLPLLRLWASGGIAYIEFPKFRFLFLRRYPWIWFEKAIEVEIEE